MKETTKEKKIIFAPYGGLGNRMRSIASAVALAKDNSSSLNIIWYAKSDLKARFSSLFLPIDISEITLCDKSHLSYRIQKRFISANLHRLFYDKCFYETTHVEACCIKEKNFISSCHEFYPYDTSLISKLFKPSQYIEKEADKILTSFSQRTIGVHIRRTDHECAIRQSPTELFLKKMKEEVSKDTQTKFYLASDSEEEKKLITEHFGDRIITNRQKANRNNEQGIKEALIEMFLLSKTTFIIGSFQSTFSMVAASLGNIPYECINQDLRKSNKA